MSDHTELLALAPESRAWIYSGEDTYIDGIPFGSTMHHGDHYVSTAPIEPEDIDLAAALRAAITERDAKAAEAGAMGEVAREWEAEAEQRRDVAVRELAFYEARRADWVAQKQTHQARVAERDAGRAVIRRLVRSTLPLHEHEWSPAETAEIRHALEDPT